MNTLLRISETPDNFLWLRKYGLKWFDSNPVKAAFIRGADTEGGCREGLGASAPWESGLEQDPVHLEEGLEGTRS